jgi:hypothetical protein
MFMVLLHVLGTCEGRRSIRPDLSVTAGDQDVGVAEGSARHLDHDLAWTGVRLGHLLKLWL